MITTVKLPVALVLFYIMALSLFLQALTWGGAYRIAAYTNLLMVIGIVIYQGRSRLFQDAKLITFGLAIVGIFVGLEWIATAHFPVDLKATRHVLLSVGLMCSITLIARDHLTIQNKLFPTIIYAVYLYTLFQLVAIYVMGRPYGTTKNPHYLAIYSAIFLSVASFLSMKTRHNLHRYLLIVSAIILGILLINTSSRPTWIALGLAIFLSILCLKNKDKIKLTALVSLIVAALFVTNFGGVKTRLDDLRMHAHTEERVTIWQDTWQMQLKSSNHEWVFGHGVEGFENNFPAYSRYHALEGIEYNSPHNLVLEILYLFGLIGLSIVLAFIAWLYLALLLRYLKHHRQTNYQWVILLLLTLLTIDLIAVSITLPFFGSINLNVMAAVIGTMFYLDKLRSR